MLHDTRLSIHAIGKIKKNWIKDGINQYKKRMPNLIINELKTFNINNLKFNNNIIISLTEEGKQLDQERDLFLKEHGIKVLRFSNNQVTKDIQNVLQKIKENFISKT